MLPKPFCTYYLKARTFSIAICCLFGLHYTKAQSVSFISGFVCNQDKIPVKNCLVTLVHPASSNLLKITFSDSLGKFEFKIQSFDSCSIKINHPGYIPYSGKPILINSSDIQYFQDTILLLSDLRAIKEVTISAKPNFIERKPDRVIIYPEALITTAGNNILDVIAKAPGVLVQPNGNIQLKGKTGVAVYIDDKPTYLNGTELESLLKTIPAAEVKQLEIMTNPSAKYDAGGNAGIILIRTKKNKQIGTNGTAAITYGQGRYPRSTFHSTLNFSNPKIAFSSGVALNTLQFFQELEIFRSYKNIDGSTINSFNQKTYIKINNQSYSGRAGLDYTISPKTTLGFNIKGLYSPTKASNDNNALLLNNSGMLTNNVLALNLENNQFINGTFNINLKHDIDSQGKQIMCHLDYVTYVSNADQNFENNVLSPNGQNTYSDKQHGELPSSIHIMAFKTDYENPFKQQAKLDIGVKSGYIITDNNAIYSITRNKITENNYDLSNQFKYYEWINAIYLNFTKSFKRIDLQTGLRYESTMIEGNQAGNPIKPSSTFTRTYNNLFPTLYISIKLDSMANHLLVTSYGYRIERPFFKDLNPFVRPLDKYTFYAGNPYLQPAFRHELSLAYSFKKLLTTTISYSHSLNNIQETVEINNGIYYSRPGNIGQSQTISLSVESNIPVTKWWNTTLYGETVFAKYTSQLYNQRLNTQGIYYTMNVSNTFSFSKNWSGELSGQFITDFIETQFSFKAFGSVTAGVQKKMFNNKGNFKISVSDLLYTNRILGIINSLENTDANWKSLTDSRIITCSFSYRFGNNKTVRPKLNTNGSESEQNRVKK